MTTGGGVAVVTNTAPYSANNRFSTGVAKEDASSVNEIAIIIPVSAGASSRLYLIGRLNVALAPPGFKAYRSPARRGVFSTGKNY